MDAECPEVCVACKKSIIHWFLGSYLEQSHPFNSKDLDIAVQVMEYRYRILHQRYLGSRREGAYRNLIIRSWSLVT
jgi:hypothetical protein